jgi:hypothetical protein
VAERIGEWRKPADKLPPVLQEVPLWINGQHVVGYYNGIAWFSRKGILAHAPSHWFERNAGVDACEAPSDMDYGNNMDVQVTNPNCPQHGGLAGCAELSLMDCTRGVRVPGQGQPE